MDEQELTAARTEGVVVGERRLLLALVWVIVALNVANAWVILSDANGWLLLGQERNPSTWFSALQLGLAAGLAWAVGRTRPDARSWNLVAGVLAVLSLDEVATFHEKLGGLPVIPGVGSRAWAGAGLVLVALVGVKLVPWATGLEPHLRTALLAGGGLFVAGAVGLEVVAGSWEDGHGQDATFWWVSSLEEDFELAGVFVVVRVLLAQLRLSGTRLTFSVAAG